MAYTYGSIKQLASYLAHATESVAYTAPVSKSVEIASFWIHNVTNNVVSALVYFPFSNTVPTASFSASLAIERLSEAFSGSVTMEISPKIPFLLNTAANSYNDKITIKASQSSSLAIAIYGREEV